MLFLRIPQYADFLRVNASILLAFNATGHQQHPAWVKAPEELQAGIFLGSSFHRFGSERVSIKKQSPGKSSGQTCRFGTCRGRVFPHRASARAVQRRFPPPPAGARALLRRRKANRRRRRRERNKVGPNLRPQGLMDVCCQLPFPPLLLHPRSSHPDKAPEEGRGRSAGRENKPDKSPEAPRLFPPALPAAPAPARLPRPAITANNHLIRWFIYYL